MDGQTREGLKSHYRDFDFYAESKEKSLDGSEQSRDEIHSQFNRTAQAAELRRDIKEARTETKIQVRRLFPMIIQGRSTGVFGQKDSRDMCVISRS